MARERRVIAILGSQGSGKTSLAKALAGRAMQRGQRVVVLSPSAWGGYQCPIDDPAALDAYLSRRIVTNRDVDLLVCDDGDQYIPRVPPNQSIWRKLALTNRHLDVDLILTGRRAQEFPPVLLSAVDVLYVFQLSSADQPGRKRLLDVAPGIQIPSEPYRFVCWMPKTASGNPAHGRTLPGGGFKILSGGK